jgi:hypothetical protein
MMQPAADTGAAVTVAGKLPPTAALSLAKKIWTLYVAATSKAYLTSNFPFRKLTIQKEPAATGWLGEHMHGLSASQTMLVPPAAAVA